MSVPMAAVPEVERTRSGGRRAARRGAGIGAAALALAACAKVAAPPVPRTVMVNVPVLSTVYCAAPALNPPALAIASLRSDSPPADTMRSYVASAMVLKSAVRERDAILRGCAAPVDGDEQNSVDGLPQTGVQASARAAAVAEAEQGGKGSWVATGGSSSAPGIAPASSDKRSGEKPSGGLVGAVAELVGKMLRPLKVSW